MKITLEMLDPIPVDDGPVTKFSHHFEEGQRVRVKETGHRGKIKTISANGHHNVMLDSGHFVECHRNEIEPEDFPSARTHVAEVSRVQKALDPLPFGDDPVVKSEKVFSHAARESFRPLLKSVALLNRALEAGAVSDRDRVLIKMAFENIETCRTIVHPLDLLGETEEHNAKMLRIMGEKYAGTPAGDTLTKTARTPDTDPEFRVGQSVRDKRTGREGKIFKLDYGIARIQYEGGELHCPCGDLEAA